MIYEELSEEVKPIFQAIQRDKRPEITPATYLYEFRPCAHDQVAQAIREALASRVIEPAGHARNGATFYRHTQIWKDLTHG